jgi:hypothetical protein
MTLYRVLIDLDICKRGELSKLEGVKPAALARLIAAGCVAPLATPPLEVLPGWDRRAARLAKHGVEDAGQLLEADTADLARALRVKAAVIEQWKSEIKSWLCPA